MSFQDCLIVQRGDDWWIVVGPDTETVAADAPADELATCVEVMSRLAGLKKLQCVLAPSATSCFFSRFDLPPETDLRDRVECTFALEDHLPIDAESMVADFRPADATGTTMKRVAAVAVPLEPWASIADALESKGIAVRAIVPASLLAVGSLASKYAQWQTVDYVLVQDSSCDWIRTHRGELTHWKHLSMALEALKQHRMLEKPIADKTVVVASDPAHRQRIELAFGSIECVPEPLGDYKLDGAELLLKRRLSTFDLRRDQLGPPDPLRPIQTPIRWAVFAAVALLIAVAFGGWYRTRRIETAVADMQQQQRALFESAFPETRVPAALLRRVRSEHARVMASRGRSGDVDLPISGRDVLTRLLTALPEDTRFRVTKIEIVDGQLDVELQVRSPVDAGTLASHLSSAGFIVKPPVTTQSDAKTFDSTLEAEWSGLPAENARVSLRWGVEGEARG